MPNSLKAQGDAQENQRIMLEKKLYALQNELDQLTEAKTSDAEPVMEQPLVNISDNQDVTVMSAALTDALADQARSAGSISVNGQQLTNAFDTDPDALVNSAFGVKASEIPEQDAGILNMADRGKDSTKWSPTGNKYYPILPDSKSTNDGGFEERLKNASLRLQEGHFWLGTTPTNLTNPKATFEMKEAGATAEFKNNVRVGDPTTVPADIQVKAGMMNESSTGSLVNAVMKAGALEYNKKIDKQVPNDMYTKIALAVTENALADLSYLEDFEGELEIDEITGKPKSESKRLSAVDQRKIDRAREIEGKDITIAKGNGALGNMIHKEYQRMVPDNDKTNLTRREAET